MSQRVDLLILHARQLVTCASAGPKRGNHLADVGIISDGALAIAGDKIIAVGASHELASRYRSHRTLNATGKAVVPGFVDAHTHVVYAGQRLNEFEMRISGASYMEIMAAGGGILGTMQAVRHASPAHLASQSRQRLNTMLQLGTTTAEIKTGYGLNLSAEMKLLRVIQQLAESHPMTLIPTFLAAHAVPPAYRTPAAYIDDIIQKMLPAAAQWYQTSSFRHQNIPFFCDAFCEAGVFSVAQSHSVLAAGLALGLRPKLHADEFNNLGGVSMAVDLDAISVDHLDVTPSSEIERLARSNTIGVLLPAVTFNLGGHHFAPARAMVDAGVALALATDINPGSAPTPAMPMVMAIATRYQNLLPAEALNASTLNAAYAVGMGSRLGSLQAGKQADILILETDDYRALAYEFGVNLVQTVIKSGKVLESHFE